MSSDAIQDDSPSTNRGLVLRGLVLRGLVLLLTAALGLLGCSLVGSVFLDRRDLFVERRGSWNIRTSSEPPRGSWGWRKHRIERVPVGTGALVSWWLSQADANN